MRDVHFNYQIWTCDCGEQRAFGFAPPPIARDSTAYILCKRCNRYTWQRYSHIETRVAGRQATRTSLLAVFLGAIGYFAPLVWALWAAILYRVSL